MHLFVTVIKITITVKKITKKRKKKAKKKFGKYKILKMRSMRQILIFDATNNFKYFLQDFRVSYF